VREERPFTRPSRPFMHPSGQRRRGDGVVVRVAGQRGRARISAGPDAHSPFQPEAAASWAGRRLRPPHSGPAGTTRSRIWALASRRRLTSLAGCGVTGQECGSRSRVGEPSYSSSVSPLSSA
jgi:hypothetical protein